VRVVVEELSDDEVTIDGVDDVATEQLVMIDEVFVEEVKQDGPERPESSIDKITMDEDSIDEVALVKEDSTDEELSVEEDTSLQEDFPLENLISLDVCSEKEETSLYDLRSEYKFDWVEEVDLVENEGSIEDDDLL
jgi:hypothetical protein